ncbi:hypothetical protein [uncultured Methanobrevibacter sp.]|uniref:hypothetical protein n=1 Tax=uncultured Methanobrevibacter sp. TaxID=253161 RepID=UPI0025F1F93C|nr:hypothetical protein [uncultured Methanobrevibacter sp.]
MNPPIPTQYKIWKGDVFMSNESIKEVITKLKDEKIAVQDVELIDNVIAFQLERISELDALPEVQEDTMTNLVDLLILRKEVC